MDASLFGFVPSGALSKHREEFTNEFRFLSSDTQIDRLVSH